MVATRWRSRWCVLVRSMKLLAAVARGGLILEHAPAAELKADKEVVQ